MTVTARGWCYYLGQYIERKTIRRSEMLPASPDQRFGPDPEIDVFRVNGIRDFELLSDARTWVEGGNAEQEWRLHLLRTAPP